MAAATPPLPCGTPESSSAISTAARAPRIIAVDTTQWFPKVNRKEYTVALNLTGNGIDEPDQNFYENYVCGAEGNYNKYCNPELDKMVDRQSMEANQEKRKALVWEIERKLAE